MKKLAGTARPDRVNAGEPRPPDASTYCPRDLPESAKKWWRKVAPMLGKLGLLTVADLPAARDLVVTITRLQECEALIEEQGILVKSARGDGQVKNPAIAVANAYRQALYRWASKFGLTPADRSGLSVPGAPEQLSLAEMLFNMAVSDDD
jgi:P27 family predicted phage terminase small subunit